MEEHGEPDQHPNHGQMQQAGDPERGVEAERLGNAEQAGFAVVLHILAGIEDVEAGDPAGDDQR